MNRRFFLLIAAISAVTGLSACNPEPQDEVTGVRKAVENLQQQYDELIAERAGDPVEWAANDIENLGDWEYRVEALPFESEESLAERLNELGNDRWEVIWLEPRPNGFMVILKKPSISLLSKLPLSQLGRLVIDGSGGSE